MRRRRLGRLCHCCGKCRTRTTPSICWGRSTCCVRATIPAKKMWYAIVTTEKRTASQPQRDRSQRDRSGGAAQPKSTHPATFGTAKTRKPSQPYCRSMIAGRNMPMHQVQLLARNSPHPIVRMCPAYGVSEVSRAARRWCAGAVDESGRTRGRHVNIAHARAARMAYAGSGTLVLRVWHAPAILGPGIVALQADLRPARRSRRRAPRSRATDFGVQ